MTSSLLRRSVAVLPALLLTAAATAQVPKITVDQAECVPKGDNGIIYATLASEVGGVSNRLFFRWVEDEDFYWVDLHPEGGGRYWAVPPKPDRDNEAIEYYGEVIDPAGNVLARTDLLEAPVESDCQVDLTAQQRGVAENLTVGETTDEQKGEEVDGFLCDGVVTRIDPDGVTRSDERCRACVIAWWERKAVILPLAGAAGITIIAANDNPEGSPSAP